MNRADVPDRWEDLLAGYALDNLNDAEQAELARLLRDHPELRAELEAYEQTLDQLPLTLPQQMPSKQLETRLFQMVQASSPSPPAIALSSAQHLQLPPQRSSPQRRWAVLAGGAIAAIALIVLGMDNWRLRQSLAARQAELLEVETRILQLQETLDQSETVLATLREPNSQIFNLAGTGDLSESTGSLITVPGHSEVALVAKNLPTLPADQVYRLWVIDDRHSDPVYCGQFNANATGAIRWTVPASVCVDAPTQVLITIDLIQTPPIRGGELVMQSRIS